MAAAELPQACDFASTYQMPSIVVHPVLVQRALQLRDAKKAAFKIITCVDWSRGDQHGINKFVGLSTYAMRADGFEVLLSYRDDQDNSAEVELLTSFIRNYISDTAEVRYVLGSLDRSLEEVLAICAGLPKNGVAYVRNDHHTKGQISKFSPKAHNELIDRVKATVPCRVKVSGNVDSLRFVSQDRADRYAVSSLQIQKIIKDVAKEVEKAKHV